jgi:phospholipase C
LSDTWSLGAIGVANCDLSVHGPNGFFRAFKGSVAGLRSAQLDVQTDYDEKGGDLTLFIRNPAAVPAHVVFLDKYKGQKFDVTIMPGARVSPRLSLDRESGWYDLVITVESESSIEYHFAGHVENGKDSISDPAIGAF